jgi:hypothetical protein
MIEDLLRNRRDNLKHELSLVEAQLAQIEQRQQAEQRERTSLEQLKCDTN